MEETAQLESRIDRAMARIRALSGANAALSGKLDELKAARDKDLAELDALVNELKPLMED